MMHIEPDCRTHQFANVALVKIQQIIFSWCVVDMIKPDSSYVHIHTYIIVIYSGLLAECLYTEFLPAATRRNLDPHSSRQQVTRRIPHEMPVRQCRILGISWHQFVRNEEVAALTGLSSLPDIICRRRSAIFGHIARLGEEVPAHKALRNCISLSLGRLPDLSWRRRPRRPRGRWIDQLRRDNSQPLADLWRQAINRGNSGRATQRSSDYATT